MAKNRIKKTTQKDAQSKVKPTNIEDIHRYTKRFLALLFSIFSLILTGLIRQSQLLVGALSPAQSLMLASSQLVILFILISFQNASYNILSEKWHKFNTNSRITKLIRWLGLASCVFNQYIFFAQLSTFHIKLGLYLLAGLFLLDIYKDRSQGRPSWGDRILGRAQPPSTFRLSIGFTKTNAYGWVEDNKVYHSVCSAKVAECESQLLNEIREVFNSKEERSTSHGQPG